MREVQISKKYKLREDGILIDIKTGEERHGTEIRQGYAVGVNGKTLFVHQLVMQYFGIECPGEGYKIWHKNGNNLDNRIENLEWVTLSQINSRRPDALPEGERRCDYESIEEYNRAKCRRHYENHQNEQYLKHREKRLIEAKKYRELHHEECLERTRKWREENKEYIKEKNKEIREKRTQDEQDKINKRRRENYANSPELQAKHIAENRAYEQENKEKVKLYHKIWREEHKEIILEKAKEQRIKHREKHIEASKRWAEEHKEQIAERRRQRIAENPEYYKAKSRAWKEANREKCREYCRKYREKKKAQENPEAFIDVISNQD